MQIPQLWTGVSRMRRYFCVYIKSINRNIILILSRHVLEFHRVEYLTSFNYSITFHCSFFGRFPSQTFISQNDKNTFHHLVRYVTEFRYGTRFFDRRRTTFNCKSHSEGIELCCDILWFEICSFTLNSSFCIAGCTSWVHSVHTNDTKSV